MIGIYQIKNLVNGKRYIGSALNINSRWNTHRSRLNRGDIHCNPYLLNAWNKYGEHNFEFTIIEQCTEDNIHDRELYWMHEVNSLFPGGYNLREAGNHGSLSQDTKRKIGIANSTKKRTTEFKENLSNMYKGTKSHSAKLDEEKVREIYIRFKNGEKYQVLSKEFGVSNQAITNIGKKIGWAWLTDKIDEEVKNNVLDGAYSQEG